MLKECEKIRKAKGNARNKNRFKSRAFYDFWFGKIV